MSLLFRALLVGLAGVTWLTAIGDNDSEHSDATGDWIFINSVLEGRSPFEGLGDLGSRLSVDFWDSASASDRSRPSYRTPGGLVLLSPLILVSAQHAHLLVNLIGLLAFLWLTLYAIPRICRRPVDDLILPIALATASVTYSDAVFWGNVSPIVAALSAWIMIRPRSVTGGGLLGLATLMKLYPGLLVIPLILKRGAARAALAWGGIVLAASLLGAVIFQFSIGESVKLITGGAKAWQGFVGNTSIAAWLLDQGAPNWVVPAVTFTGIALVAAVSYSRPMVPSLMFSGAVAVLVSPVSWTHYGLLALPAVIWLWSRGTHFRFGLYVSGAWLFVGLLTNRAAELLGWETTRGIAIAVRIALALAVALAPPVLWNEQGFEEPDLVVDLRGDSAELALR